MWVDGCLMCFAMPLMCFAMPLQVLPARSTFRSASFNGEAGVLHQGMDGGEHLRLPLKQIGSIYSYLACKIGHLVPILAATHRTLISAMPWSLASLTRVLERISVPRAMNTNEGLSFKGMWENQEAVQ
jgi:hypothetical protein